MIYKLLPLTPTILNTPTMQKSGVPEIRIQLPSASGDSNSASNTMMSINNDLEVQWNPFHQRVNNLANFPTSDKLYRATYRSQTNSMNRAKLGCETHTTKSLNILREALQRSMNKEIHDVIQKYLDTFFKPAFENIKANSGATTVSEHHLQSVCHRILEEAKKMYYGGLSHPRSHSPVAGASTRAADDSDHENNLLKVPRSKKRPHSDSDSEIESRKCHFLSLLKQFRDINSSS